MFIFMIYDCLFHVQVKRLCKKFMFCIFSVFKQEKPLFKVHSSEVNKAKSKWKALLARLSHDPPHIHNSFSTAERKKKKNRKTT